MVSSLGTNKKNQEKIKRVNFPLQICEGSSREGVSGKTKAFSEGHTLTDLIPNIKTENNQKIFNSLMNISIKKYHFFY